MDMLKPLMRRVAKFPAMDVVRASGLSKALVYDLIASRRTGVNLDTYAKLEKAVVKLEAAAAKAKSSGKTAKKQTASRDKARRAMASKPQ